jgi:hypothetical protein
VIHTAFTNVSPTTDFAAACQADAAAISALGTGLEGSGKLLVITSGTAAVNVPGRAATEDDPATWGPRVIGEQTALALTDRGVRISVARLSLSVHDGHADRKGFVPALIALAREKGASAYVGDGTNRWTAVHCLDAARLFRLALESAPAGARLHGVGDEGVPFRAIAEAIGAGLGLPVTSVSTQEAETHFGYLAAFVALDNPSSNARTEALLGWQPEHPGPPPGPSPAPAPGRRPQPGAAPPARRTHPPPRPSTKPPHARSPRPGRDTGRDLATRLAHRARRPQQDPHGQRGHRPDDASYQSQAQRTVQWGLFSRTNRGQTIKRPDRHLRRSGL